MKTIATEGFERPKSVSAGAHPELKWLAITDLVLEPVYQRRLEGSGRTLVNYIAKDFSWTRFVPVVVAPRDDGKFAVIDGHRRTTAAAVAGFDKVPCQIVRASPEQQMQAFNAINGRLGPMSRMGLHAVGIATKEACAVNLTEICARAGVELLRYPVPVDRQAPGQTMAVGTMEQCLARYGEETLITALQCVTQTTNNKPGALSARVIKALCEALERDPHSRDCGLALLEAFDHVDLQALEKVATEDAIARKIRPAKALAEKICTELSRIIPHKAPLAPARPGSVEIAKPKETLTFPPRLLAKHLTHS